MGRALKPIPDDRPAKLLGDKLRELKGTLTYNELGKAAHCKPNTLSTTADGTYRGWPSVEQFLNAIRSCGGTVTDQDVQECKAKHRIAARLYAQSRPPAPLPTLPPAALTDTTVLVPIAPDAALTEDGETVAASTDADDDTLTMAVAGDRPVLDFTHTAPAKAYPVSLAAARSTSDIVAALIDLVMDKRLDIDSWRTRGPWTPDTARSGSPEWLLLTGRQPPTLDVVRNIVVQCGGDHADVTRWEQTWRRVVTDGTDRAVGVAQVSVPLRGSEIQTAYEAPDVTDEELQRVHDALRRVTGGANAPPVRMAPWWRRGWYRLRPRRPPPDLTAFGTDNADNENDTK
jgi:hypothetical protein